jgi:exportin-2 (importin alpha re-exporter)
MFVPNRRYDKLITSCIAVLNQVSVGVHAKNLFSDPQTLKQICENVVIPNIHFRDTDEEAFRYNPQEYIRRDIEGSDSDTRRRAACELIRGLRKVRNAMHVPD